MPYGDGTGPQGAGPGTGRRMGYCAGHPVPGFVNRPFGRGFGRGFGWGARAVPVPVETRPIELPKDQQIKILESEKKELAARLEALEKKIKELSG